ncbi:MAG: SpoIIE family protein phosphatase [Planctomycetota bacterium]|jgi:sigma-B regulation protein RsbU (phosphoserine phosphatase)
MSDTDKKFTILAVDDTPENLDVVKGILTPEFIVKAATSGAMALKIAEKQAPDLILLDIMMPEMDGYEVCRRLKADEQTRDIPVIFLTAMDQTTDEAQGFGLGAADYMTKPVNPPILQARVRTHLALKQSMDELQSAYSIIKRHKERMEQELNVGRDIQMSMLPLEFPAFPDRKEFDIHALLKPAREVGGDFYDFFFISENEICLIVGDVSGKGVPAALFMAVTKTMIKTRAADDHSPASIVTRVNDELSADNPASMFVTLFLGVVNLQTGGFRYTNAGHNPPYILRSGGNLQCLDQRHGPIIAAVEGVAFKETAAELGRGDTVLIFTDGVTEAMDTGQQLYSESRLEDLLGRVQDRQPDQLTNSVILGVEEFATGAEQADDITILAFCLDQDPEHIEHDRLDLIAKFDLAEIDRVNDAFNQFAESHSISASIKQKVNIALDDLLNNVISYAHENSQGHEIEIGFDYSQGRLVITVSDDGIPFNPFDRVGPDTTLSIEERELGGLGVLLVTELMDEYAYQRNRDSNVVTLQINTETPKN